MTEDAIILMQDINSIGVKVIVHNGNLQYYPRSLLDANPTLKASLIKHKKEVIAYLSSGTGTTLEAGTDCMAPSSKCGSTTRKQPTGGTTLNESINFDTWDESSKPLIKWFLEEGQHLIPDEPFRLTSWQFISDPRLFKKAIFFGISVGPDKVGLRHGTFADDLKRLKVLFDSDSIGEMS